jgi:hypothetical protein
MNLLKSLYCNQYLELKEKGREAVAKKNGTALVIIALALNILFALAVLAHFPDFRDSAEDLLRDVFGRTGGRTIGRIIALIPFALVYPVIKLTMDREENYRCTIEAFEAMDAQQQAEVSNRGKWYFYVSLGLFVAGMLSLLFI